MHSAATFSIDCWKMPGIERMAFLTPWPSTTNTG